MSENDKEEAGEPQALDSDTGAPRDYWLGREFDAEKEVRDGLAELRRDKRELTLGHIPPLVSNFGRRAYAAGAKHEHNRLDPHITQLAHENARLKREIAYEKNELEHARHYTTRMRDWRYDVINRFEKHHGGNISKGHGTYRGTVQIPLLIEGTASGGVFTQPIVANPDSPNIFTVFDYAQNDTVAWIGGNHVLTPSDTNLANAGFNLFQNELFIIEKFRVAWKGVRVVYPGSVTSGVTGVTGAALSGNVWLYDTNGNILPSELWNPLTDSCRLAEVLGETATLHFMWQDKWTGGSKATRDVMVAGLSGLPTLGRRAHDVRETSGGGLQGALDVPEGNIWCLDKQFQASSDMGGNGLFNAAIQVSDASAFPFIPIVPLGGASATPALPTAFAVYYEVTLIGTSLLPGKVWEKREKDSRLRREDDRDFRRYHRAEEAHEHAAEKRERE